MKGKFTMKIIICCLLAFLMLGIWVTMQAVADTIDYYRSIDRTACSSYQNTNCFYEWAISPECNGTIRPVTDDKSKYWNCEEMNWTVRAC